MTLELSKLAGQVRAMGRELAAREREHVNLVALARAWLTEYADRGERLRHPARCLGRTAIPTDEPLDAIYPLPAIPDRFTVVAVDGSLIQPDRHSAALYYLINVGSLVYRHGSGEPPLAHSEPTLGYTEADLYENGLLVAGNLLDVRRDLAEITRLADLCAAEPQPIVALVDGTLILWVLEERPEAWQQAKVIAYLDQLERIRKAGAAVASFISRPRRGEVTRLLHLASVDGDLDRAAQEPNPLEYLPDRRLFENLPAGARSALFIHPSPINDRYYAPSGHAIHFCYLNVAEEGREPVVARLEVPVWVARDADLLALVHGAVVAQARITGDYPYVLARADELAFIGGPEREAFEEMIVTALLHAGLRTGLSPKQYYKTLTRGGRQRYRL